MVKSEEDLDKDGLTYSSGTIPFSSECVLCWAVCTPGAMICAGIFAGLDMVFDCLSVPTDYQHTPNGQRLVTSSTERESNGRAQEKSQTAVVRGG